MDKTRAPGAKMKGMQFKQVRTLGFLGFDLIRKLTWSDHMNKKKNVRCSKCNGMFDRV